MAFIRDVGVAMPCLFTNRPIYQEHRLCDILDQTQDTLEELTMTQMQKIARVFERRGTWAHPMTRVLLGSANNLVTFKFINAPEPHADQQVFGYAIFEGPTWTSSSPWFGKQVVIRAFPSTEAPTLYVNVSGEVTFFKPDVHGTRLIPEYDVTVAGALAGTMQWSKVYDGTTHLHQIMKTYRSHVTRTRRSNGEPMGEVEFLVGHTAVDIHKGRMSLSQLWPPTHFPTVSTKRARDDISRPPGSPPSASSSQAAKKPRTLSTQTYGVINIS